MLPSWLRSSFERYRLALEADMVRLSSSDAAPYMRHREVIARINALFVGDGSFDELRDLVETERVRLDADALPAPLGPQLRKVFAQFSEIVATSDASRPGALMPASFYTLAMLLVAFLIQITFTERSLSPLAKIPLLFVGVVTIRPVLLRILRAERPSDSKLLRMGRLALLVMCAASGIVVMAIVVTK